MVLFLLWWLTLNIIRQWVKFMRKLYAPGDLDLTFDEKVS